MTTPGGRTDLVVGASARLPTGDLRNVETYRDAAQEAEGGGVAPVGRVRHGIAEGFDAGATVVGPLVSIDLGAEVWRDATNPLRPALRATAMAYGGLFDGGHRVGADLPVVFTMNASSLLETWIGVRLGVEGAWGDAAGEPLSVRGLRVGGVIGLAAGFRSFHALLELTAFHEWWRGSLGEQRIAANGVALVPAFALRLRL